MFAGRLTNFTSKLENKANMNLIVDNIILNSETSLLQAEIWYTRVRESVSNTTLSKPFAIATLIACNTVASPSRTGIWSDFLVEWPAKNMTSAFLKQRVVEIPTELWNTTSTLHFTQPWPGFSHRICAGKGELHSVPDCSPLGQVSIAANCSKSSSQFPTVCHD